MRADIALVDRGLAESRAKAKALIEAGLVTVDGLVISKPSAPVGPETPMRVLGELHPYVGRGGLKLEKAIKAFDVPVANRVCADIGASTGGFTDVLLRNGARHVYAVDVGEGQLAQSLRDDARVTVMEHTNARTLTAASFPEPPSLAVMDVSFISIRLILPALAALLEGEKRIVTLVKPQFEAGRDKVGKKGIVSAPSTHEAVLLAVCEYAREIGWHARAFEVSPITGSDGNVEFLADLLPGEGEAPSRQALRALVAEAHRAH